MLHFWILYAAYFSPQTVCCATFLWLSYFSVLLMELWPSSTLCYLFVSLDKYIIKLLCCLFFPLWQNKNFQKTLYALWAIAALSYCHIIAYSFNKKMPTYLYFSNLWCPNSKYAGKWASLKRFENSLVVLFTFWLHQIFNDWPLYFIYVLFTYLTSVKAEGLWLVLC